MVNEANSDLSHKELVSYTAQHLRRKQWRVWTEYLLPDGKRADVLGIDPHGVITIFEAKTIVRQHERNTATDRYWAWCNKLYLVTNQTDPPLPVSKVLSLPDGRADMSLGIARCDRLDIIELREPRVHAIDADREARLRLEASQRPTNTPWLNGRLVPAHADR